MVSHRGDAPAREVGCGILSVSDSRDPAHDLSGAAIRGLLLDGGYPVVWYELVRDEPAAIRAALERALEQTDVVAVVITGGTGIAERDVTIESVDDLWTKVLPGFGELLRSLSFAEIGPAAFLSRATAGIVRGKFVAILPGSPAACRLATERLIVPSLRHIAALLAPTP